MKSTRKDLPAIGGRRLVAALLGAFLWTLVVAPGASAAGPAPGPSTIAPPVDVARGFLTKPSRRAPADLARAFVSDTAGLASADLGTVVRHLPRGTVVEVTAVHRGLPVVGAAASIRLDDEGRVRWMRSSLHPIPAGLSLAPAIDARQALGLAGATRLDEASVARARPRLVVWAPPGAAPRLAWRVLLPTDPVRLEAWDTLVDARSGALIGRRNLIRRAAGHLARVHPENPLTTPTPVEVTFTELPAAATSLTGPDVTATTCVDDHQCRDRGDGPQHMCGLSSIAPTNAAGNFLDHAMPRDPLDPADPFAEVAAYFHTTKAYAFFRELVGDPAFALDGAPVMAIANMREPGLACAAVGPAPRDSSLSLVNNAYFAPPGTSPFDVPGAAIAMGQGTMGDFDYDGDIVYHELAHGLIYTLAPELGFSLPHPHGGDVTPGGLVEGLPDYLSAALTEDPELGEFIGPTVNFPPHVRNLDNDASCPTDLSGEPHTDGQIIGGALWEIRSGLAAEQRPTLDRAVVTAIGASGADTGFADFQATLVAELAVVLGEEVAASASAVFAARGVDDCDDFVRELGPGQTHTVLLFVGFPPVPAAVQFRVVLAAPVPSMRLRAAAALGSSAAGLALLIKPGDEPIGWTDGPDAPRSVELVSDDGASFDQVIEGPFPAGVYHLQLVSSELFALADIGLEYDLPGADAGPDDGPDAGDGDPAATDDGGGCGCRAAGDRGVAGPGLLIVAVLAAGRRRRRSRPTPRRVALLGVLVIVLLAVVACDRSDPTAATPAADAADGRDASVEGYDDPADFPRKGCDPDPAVGAAALAGLWHIDVVFESGVGQVGPLRLDGAAADLEARLFGMAADVRLGDDVIVRAVGDDGELTALDVCGVRDGDTLFGHLVSCSEGTCRAGDATLHAVRALDEPAAEGLELLAELGPERAGWPYSPQPRPGAFSATANVRHRGTTAYVVRMGDGLRIVDLTSPAAPVELAHAPVADPDEEEWNDVKIVEGPADKVFALVASNRRGVVVIDVTDPAAPAEVAQFPDTGFDMVHTLAIEGDRAYLADLVLGGLSVYDIADPAAPTLLGTYVDPGTGLEPGSIAFLHDLQVVDGLAYLCYWGAGVVAVDTTALPGGPVALVGRFADYPRRTSHSAWATEAGGRRIVLHGDEDLGAHLRILDGDRDGEGFLGLVAEYQTRPEVSIHNVMAQGDVGVLAYYQDGVRLLDLADPTAPTLLGHFATWPGPAAPGYGDMFFEGTVGVDVDPDRGLILVADSHRGLLVLQPSAAIAARLRSAPTPR